jgi:hypothetical protein
VVVKLAKTFHLYLLRYNRDRMSLHLYLGFAC